MLWILLLCLNSGQVPLQAEQSQSESEVVATFGPPVPLEDICTAVAFSADGHFAYTSFGLGGVIYEWNVGNGKCIRGFKADCPVNQLIATPDGQNLIASAMNNPILIFDLKTGNKKHTLKDTNSAVSVSCDGQRIYYGRTGGIGIWDFRRGKIELFDLHEEFRPYFVSCSPEGKRLIFPGKEEDLEVWDIGTQRTIRRIATGALSEAIFTSDGLKILCNGSTLYDADTGTLVSKLESSTQSSCSRIALKDRFAAVCDLEGELRTWDIASGKLHHTFGVAVIRGHPIAVSPDGKTILAARESSQSASVTFFTLWNAESGKAEAHLRMADTRRQNWSLSITPDGRRVMFPGGNTLQFWDLASGDYVQGLEASANPVSFGAISPDGKSAVSLGEDHTVAFWNLQTGEQVGSLQKTAELLSARFTPDGRWLITANRDQTMSQYETSTGRWVCNFAPASTNYPTSISFTPDGRTMATANSDNGVFLWSMDSPNKKPRTITPKPFLNSISRAFFLGKGTQILTVLGQNPAILDSKTGNVLKRFELDATDICAGMDGCSFATALGNGMIAIGSVESTKEVRRRDHPHATTVTMSPSGRIICTRNLFGRIEVWRPGLRHAQLAASACADWDTLSAGQRKTILDTVLAKLESPEFGKGNEALEWLAVLGPRAIPALSAAYPIETDEVRWGRLLKLLDDEDAAVRTKAIEGFRRFGARSETWIREVLEVKDAFSPKAKATLLELLDSRSWIDTADLGRIRAILIVGESMAGKEALFFLTEQAKGAESSYPALLARWALSLH